MHNSTALSSAPAPVKRRILTTKLSCVFVVSEWPLSHLKYRIGFYGSFKFFLWWCSLMFFLHWLLWYSFSFRLVFISFISCFDGCQLMFSFCVSHFYAEMFCCFVSNSIGWIICPLKRQKIPLINQQGWITNPPVPDC